MTMYKAPGTYKMNDTTFFFLKRKYYVSFKRESNNIWLKYLEFSVLIHSLKTMKGERLFEKSI